MAGYTPGATDVASSILAGETLQEEASYTCFVYVGLSLLPVRSRISIAGMTQVAPVWEQSF